MEDRSRPILMRGRRFPRRETVRPFVKRMLLGLLMLFALATPAAAQVPVDIAPSDTIYRVELRRDQVRSMRPMEGEVVDGRVLLPDRNASRLFFGPTARGLPAGQGYVGVFELFFAIVSYAPTDHLIMSGGTMLPLGFELGEVLYLGPKINFLSRGSLDLAAGVMAMFGAREGDGSAGVVYGAATKGDPNRAVTLGGGWGYLREDADAELGYEPVIMFGLEDRVSPRVKLLSESYLFPGGSTLMVGGGARLLGERFTGDLGIGVGASRGDGVLCCVPLVNLMYMFGGND